MNCILCLIGPKHSLLATYLKQTILCQVFNPANILPFFQLTKLKILDGFLTVPYSSSLLIIYTHFLESLSLECSRTCLNCYVFSATLLVHDLIAPCLDYCNRLLVSSFLVCSNCYFHDATPLRVLNDFLKVW